MSLRFHPSKRTASARRRLLALALGAAFDWADPASALGAEEAIVIVGAERMAPLNRRLAERFRELHPDVSIQISGGETVNAIPLLVQGNATIAALDRPANEEELHRVRVKRKQEAYGVPIAMDAVVFLVHPRNPLESLTFEQIQRIFTQQITEWEQLNVPLKTVRRVTPPIGSGPMGVLHRQVMGGKGFTSDRAEKSTTLDVVRAFEEYPLAVGVGAMDYAGGLSLVAIRRDAGSPAVLPSQETIRSRDYPLSHYLYWYFTGEPTGSANALLAFAVGPEGQTIVQSYGKGAVSLPLHDVPTNDPSVILPESRP